MYLTISTQDALQLASYGVDVVETNAIPYSFSYSLDTRQLYYNKAGNSWDKSYSIDLDTALQLHLIHDYDARIAFIRNVLEERAKWGY